MIRAFLDRLDVAADRGEPQRHPLGHVKTSSGRSLGIVDQRREMDAQRADLKRLKPQRRCADRPDAEISGSTVSSTATDPRSLSSRSANSWLISVA